MKIYSLKELIGGEKEEVHNYLIKYGCSEYKAGMLMLDIYSFVGELTFRPMRLNSIMRQRKKGKLDDKEFRKSLDNLIGKKFYSFNPFLVV